MDELAYFNARVWEGLAAHDARADPKGKVLNGRWVLANKSDLASHDCTARCMACEINRFEDLSFFAATPHPGATHLLMSQWALERRRDGQRLQLQFADAKQAYFNGKPHRSVHNRLSKELGLGPNVLGVDAMEATRCAATCVKRARPKTSTMELFGRGNITGMANGRARTINIQVLDALDLRTCKRDGSPWVVTCRADRNLAVDLVKHRRPTWSNGSPPCTRRGTRV